MNRIQEEDCHNIGKAEFIDWERFRNATVLITGSTGLIGANLVNALAVNGAEKDLKIKLILPVRDTAAATEQFSWTGARILPYELGEKLMIDENVDYIVHLASPTSSKFFKDKPVDTLQANLFGTNALLEWAREHKSVKKFIYVSTMEVYGFPQKGQLVKEKDLGAFETMNPRNCYPLSKMACEALCNGFASQYGVPAVVLRATQTFGPGVKYQDGRVFAQFMRCAMEKNNIVLKSEGLTERSYLYTADAVTAILSAALNGISGEAYTIANPKTYCSIREMARLVAEDVAGGEIQIEFDLAEDVTKLGYAETLYMNLDVSKMEGLGWHPSTDLKEMFIRMIKGTMEDEKRSRPNEYV